MSAGVNVNTPALLYAKLPLPLGDAVVTLKEVKLTLLPPLPVWSPASNLFELLFQTSTCPFVISVVSTSLSPATVMAAAAVVGFIANVIVSVFAAVVRAIPVPAAIVKSSSNFSALTVVWPDIMILAKPKLALPLPPLPLTATVSTELILP